MGISIISGLLGTIGSAIDTVADKIAPDKNIQLQTEVGWKKWTPKFGKIFNGGVTYEKCPKGEIHEGISRRGG